MIASLCIGFTLVVALLLWLHRKLDGLPHTLSAVAKKERDAHETKALDRMTETVAQKAGQSLVAIITYHERLVTSLREEIAQTETRARVGERRASDAATALSSVTGDLRALLDNETIAVRERQASLDSVAQLVRELSALRELTCQRDDAGPKTLPTDCPLRAAEGEDEETMVADRSAGDQAWGVSSIPRT